jgi:myosin-1
VLPLIALAVLLDGVDENKIAATLASRLKAGSMYTSIGPVLVAVNPYKLLTGRDGRAIYDDRVADAHRGRTRIEMPPHIFAVAENAYSSMLRFSASQSVIVSGESGAGKTEACRQVLSYLTRVSSQAAAGQPLAAQRAVRVRDRLITANTVLEAFGNAATIRNSNSSRFGKLMTTSFSAGGVATSGAVSVYLLEKHRVVFQSEGERNFHVLHQLSSGAGPDLRSSLRIGPPQSYAYLSNEARAVPGVNDAANFKGLIACLNLLGIEAAQQRDMFRVLSTVLALGNVEITSDAEQERAKAGGKGGGGGGGGGG